MVESALEFARIARELDYHDFVFSMKSSNPKVMIKAYRLLVARLLEGGPGLELPDPPRRDRGRRRRGRPHQERHRHRLAAARRHRRHHPRLAHRGQRPRNPRRARARRTSRAQQRQRIRTSRRTPSIRALLRSLCPIAAARRRASIVERRSRARRRGNRSASSIRQATFDKHRAQARPHRRLQAGDRSRKNPASSRSIRATTTAIAAEINARTDAALVTIADGLDLARHRRLPPARRASSTRAIRSCSRTRLTPAPDPEADFLRTMLTRRDATSARCSATASATPSSCRANPPPGKRCARLQHPAGRRRAHLQDRLRRLPDPAAARSSICRPPPRGSKPPPRTSRA